MKKEIFNNPKEILGQTVCFEDKIKCSECNEDDDYRMCENFGNPKECPQRIVKEKVESIMYSNLGCQTVYIINKEYEFTEQQMEDEVYEEGKSKRHKIKALTEFFLLVCAGKKNFECRFDDRDIQIGDYVQLEEWSQETGYTGSVSRWLHISYVMRDKPDYGLISGYCIFSWDN